ncbi:hypothetical protein DU226_05720 [Salmonella enterica subsp. enterica serovar Enteritidis]|nr:hypothetical protein [Salmonella enterica subsp. enterica serovar Enteritidis]
MPVMVEVSAEVKMLLGSELFFLIFGPQVLYGLAGLAPGQKENAVMRKKSPNLARGRLLSQVLNWQRQRRDFPDTAWGTLMLTMLPADERVAEDLLFLVAPELMRLFRDGLKRVTDGEMALFRGCGLKTLHEYPLLRVLTDGVFADDCGELMQYRSDWLAAASVWLRDMIPVVHTSTPSAETACTALLAMAFDDFHALVHATAYENSISMPAHDGDDLLSISLSAQNAPLEGKSDLHHVLIRLPPRANDISEVQG